MLFRRKVLHGEKLGRKLGFPTVNFHVGSFGEHFRMGVYSCIVTFSDMRKAKSGKRKVKVLTADRLLPTTLKGALYFGPKGMGKNVLEIHLLDFSGDLYGQRVSFEVGEKIRAPKAPKNLEDLKAMIESDIQNIRALRHDGRKF